MKKSAILSLLMALANLSFANGVEENKLNSELKPVDAKSIKELVPAPENPKIELGTKEDFLVGIGVMSPKTRAELEYVRQNFNKVEESAIWRLHADTMSIPEFTPQKFAKYYGTVLREFEQNPQTIEAIPPSKEAFETLVFVNRKIWHVYDAGSIKHPVNLSLFAKLVRPVADNISNALRKAGSLERMKTDANLIAENFIYTIIPPDSELIPNPDNLKSTQNDKEKLNFCWFKELKGNTCVYKCKNGAIYETPAQRPSPWDEFVIPCPQIVFPF
ncbi:MAG: hypothetical protein HY746_07635 [Elusimicrobia bacterium]|nr:hypothetical protein [Elusimicrobiota bacterium]